MKENRTEQNRTFFFADHWINPFHLNIPLLKKNKSATPSDDQYGQTIYIRIYRNKTKTKKKLRFLNQWKIFSDFCSPPRPIKSEYSVIQFFFSFSWTKKKKFFFISFKITITFEKKTWISWERQLKAQIKWKKGGGGDTRSSSSSVSQSVNYGSILCELSPYNNHDDQKWYWPSPDNIHTHTHKHTNN